MRKKINKSNEDRLFESPVATFNTLIVCLGNTCRSAIMHSLFEHRKPANHKYFSIGTTVKEKTVADNTKKTLDKNNIPLAKETPQSFKDINHDSDFDRLIILDKTIKLEDLEGVEYRKIIRLDIEDPEDEDLASYQKTFDVLEKHVNDILERKN